MAFVVSAVTNAISSRNAANTQAGAAASANAMQERMFNQTQANLQPYMQYGQNAAWDLQKFRNASTPALNNLGQLGNQGAGAANQLYSALSDGSLGGTFDNAALQKNLAPNYDFQLKQGTNALMNSEAAQNGAMSGAAMKDLINFNQNTAQGAYQNAYNNWMQGQNMRYNMLSGAAGMGANANQSLAGMGANSLQGLAGIGQAAAAGAAANGSNFANSMANTQLQGANAQAAGYKGVGNALSNGLQMYQMMG